MRKKKKCIYNKDMERKKGFIRKTSKKGNKAFNEKNRDNNKN